MTATAPSAVDVVGTYRLDTASDVLVLDGYGLSLSVERGHLLARDGLGTARRERRLSRAQRHVRRIVILGHTGHLTLDAIRWCTDLGIRIVQLDTGGRILTLAGTGGADDARLRRAQACASPETATAVARMLLTPKIRGQADIAAGLINNATAAKEIHRFADQLTAATSVTRCTELEAAAANTYFSAWTDAVTVRFARHDTSLVPAHWHQFSQRRSPLTSTNGPYKAADPINALLNYTYALAEAECRIAAVAVGLDPGLGFVHTDRTARDSLALDLLECVRPAVDTYVLRLLTERTLSRRDVHETRDGNCQLLAPLTHIVAETLPSWASVVAPHAEALAHLVADTADGRVRRTTPLTRSNTRNAQRPAGRRARKPLDVPAELPPRTCRDCGQPVASARATLCPSCNRADLPGRGVAQAQARVEKLQHLRAAGVDPTNTPEARRKRATSLRANRSALAGWSGRSTVTKDEFATLVQPALRAVPLSQLREATGLSVSACSRIRSGHLVPHERHWDALAALVTDR